MMLLLSKNEADCLALQQWQIRIPGMLAMPRC